MTPKTKALLSIIGNGTLIVAVLAFFLMAVIGEPALAIVMALLMLLGVQSQRRRDERKADSS